MSTIKVSRPHTLSRADARAKLAVFEQMLGKYGVSLAWKGDRAKIKGTGVSGEVVVEDAAVQVVLKLGMLAKAVGVDGDRLKGSITKRLNAAFDES
jgi:putative polyhydroxyalkanoate system protein